MITELAVKQELPTIYGLRAFGMRGGYGVNVPDIWWCAASYVDEILKGARPAESRSSNQPGLTSRLLRL